MRLRVVFTALILVGVLTVLPWSRTVADILTGQFIATLSSPSPQLVGRCSGGQSSAVVQALYTTAPGPTPTPSPTPPATPTPGPTSTPITPSFAITISMAANAGSAAAPIPGPTTSPYAASPGPAFSSAPSKVYLKLGSDQYIYVTGSFTQGVVPVTITCSAAQY